MLHKQSAAILGVSPHASEIQIRRAYHSLVKKFHPDVNVHSSTLHFSRISDAYKDLLSYTRTRQKTKDELYVHGNVLLKEQDRSRRFASARFLADSGKTGSYGYLKFALGDSDKEIVKICIKGLARLGFPQAGRELLALYKKSGKDIKREILSVVPGMSGYAEYRDILYYAMTEKDPFLKQEAYRIFKGIRKQSGGICQN